MATLESILAETAVCPCFDAETGKYDDGLSTFTPVRARLFGIAYRMLGSAAEAEDVVQEVWLRWQSANRSLVENPPAFLAATTSRLCINLTQSAHSRRETSIETRPSELVDKNGDPGRGAERSEALGIAVLVLFEKLTATERAAYVLREAFDYSYRQIAEILQMKEANARQLVSRARKHIADGRRTSVDPREPWRFMEAFIGAAQHGDMAELEHLFAADVASSSNDSGLMRSAPVSVSGRECVAMFTAAVA